MFYFTQSNAKKLFAKYMFHSKILGSSIILFLNDFGRDLNTESVQDTATPSK